MRICIVISELGAGGAERVVATLVDDFMQRGHSVAVVTFGATTNDFYELGTGVQRIVLGGVESANSAPRAIVANARRICALRRAIVEHRPDTVVTFVDTTNVATILATRFLGIPVVASERTYPPRHALRRPWGLLRRVTYPLADGIVMQTERGRAWAKQIVPEHRIEVIANPLSSAFLAAIPKSVATRARTIVAAGRLGREKGFDLLIEAFAASRAPALGWNLRIHGRGLEEGALRAMIRQFDLEAHVTMSGTAVPLVDEFGTAQVFVLSSRYEGFPNVLLEAMACGCAVIATDCETGPSDLITAGVNGILVKTESVASLRNALDLLIGDEALRGRLADSAQYVRGTYAPNLIAAQWLDLLGRMQAR